jgi:hypothetical protein
MLGQEISGIDTIKKLVKMKRIFTIAVVLMVVSTAAFSQLFDGTIDGAVPGKTSDVSAHFIKKGYKSINCTGCDTNLLFFDGKLSYYSRKTNVIICMVKENSEFTSFIGATFPNSNRVLLQYAEHRKMFIRSFGKPTDELPKSSKWVFATYTYTIGWEGNHIYHEIKLKK